MPLRRHGGPPAHSATGVEWRSGSLLVSRISFAFDDGAELNLVPVAGEHPPGHGTGPRGRRRDVVFLRLGAVEAVYLHHHLRHQAVVESDGAPKGFLLVHPVADEELEGRERVAGEEVLVESEDVVLQP